MFQGSPPFKLRPATLEETIGGVADFPDPAAFVQGLRDSWAGKTYRWPMDKIAPGYDLSETIPEWTLDERMD